MIDFACKRFKIEEIIKCGLGLTRADYEIFSHLVEIEKWCTTESIANKLSLNLSTVQKAVKKLHEKDILERMQKNLNNGGYIYNYRIKPKPYIRSLIMKIVDNWAKKVGESLKEW